MKPTWLETQADDDKQLQSELRQAGAMPRHIAIIMDGNGRWAVERNLPRVAGHEEGIESVRDIVKAASQIGIEYLTLYAFSMENWKRPRQEVSILMTLLEKYLRQEIRELHDNGVKLKSIGKTNALPKSVQKLLREGAEMTADNTGLTLTLALSYSGRWDIARAMQVMALDVRRGTLSPEDITEEKISSYLLTSGMPDPDLLIRTSGEKRLSNYLLWETAYAEMYITDALWPDFRRNDLYKSLLDYFGRERRFGKTSAQLLDSDNPKSECGYLQRLMNMFYAK